MNYQDFENFHAHLYYPLSEVEAAENFINLVKTNFDIPVGTVWNRPVGPHPIGSCQITLKKENYQEVIDWLESNRGPFDVFIHAVTGDDYKDHSDHVAWLGKSYDLKLEMFKRNGN